jgi:hypothetical protein
MKKPWSLAGLASVLLLASVFRSGATTNIFYAGFEPTEGYDPAYELIGQNGWTTDSTSYGGNGLLTNFFGSQAAYIGLFPLEPPTNYLYLWHPLNYSATNAPVVTFSVKMAVVDSTTTNRDDFWWTVYNTRGHQLFTLDFWNVDLGIYYALDNTNGLIYSGADFTNEVPYSLEVTMDIGQNLWSARLDDRVLVANKRISTVGARVDLGDIDAVWLVSSKNKPGDNFMVFDDFRVSAEPRPSKVPWLTAAPPRPDGQFGLRVTGPSGARYAVEATTNLVQWTSLQTNTIAGTYFDFIDTKAAGMSKRFYRARLVP